jgi:type IV secretion system protein VirD4
MRPGMWADGLSGVGAGALTDGEITRLHAQAGTAGVAATAASAWLAGATSWPLLDSLALVGATAGSMLTAATVAHRSWWTHPHTRLRRALGGPVGWLDGHDLTASCGAAAVRRHAAGLWPGRDHHRAPVTWAGWEAGRLVSGPRHLRRRRVYSPWTRGIGILGPQGSGKTQYLIGLLLQAPGAVVVPSTKPELALATMAARAAVGPVAVFNPAELGELASTLAWDPVAGCDAHATADARAWALVRGGGAAAGTHAAEFWAQKAQEIIRAYLMAAALSGRDMGAVMRWANTPDDPAPVHVLTGHPGQVPPGWVETLTTHLAAAPNTRTGYFATVSSCVGFMDNPTVAAACRPAPGRHLDVAEFLARSGTLYLIGSSADRRLAPLLTALTEHLFDTAQQLAAAQPGGRLPVPLAFLLDEVAHTTPVPLDRWAADSRGWGITVCAVVQSLAQLSATWGRDAGEIIWENLPTKVILPGVTNVEDLRALSYLGGERWTARHNDGASAGADGRRSTSVSTTRTREPVIGGDVIATLPRWHAYLLGAAPRPAVVRFTPGYQLLADTPPKADSPS